MDQLSSPGGEQRSFLEAARAALVNGINRYKSMKDAPESRTLLIGFAIMWIGARLSTVALVVLSYKIGDGAIGVGGMLAISLLPMSIFQPLGGHLVDKYPGKRLLIVAYLIFALLSFSYLLLIPFASIWLLYAIRFLFGALQSIEPTAYEMRLMMLTPASKRGTANALQAIMLEVGEIVGPLLGGILLAISGAGPLFVLTGLTCLLMATLVSRLPESVPGAKREIDEADETTMQETAEANAGAYRWIFKRPQIVAYLASAAISGALAYGIISVFVTKALDIGLNEGSIGAFLSAIGAGAMIGGIFAGMGEYATRKALIITGCSTMMGSLSLIAFGYASTFWLAIAVLVLYGMLVNLEEIPALTFFQNSLPESIYGRFFSTFMMAGTFGGFAGSLLIPWLTERYSITAAMIAFGVPAIVFGFVLATRGGGLTLPHRSLVMPATTGIVAGAIPPDDPSSLKSSQSISDEIEADPLSQIER